MKLGLTQEDGLPIYLPTTPSSPSDDYSQSRWACLLVLLLTFPWHCTLDRRLSLLCKSRRRRSKKKGH